MEVDVYIAIIVTLLGIYIFGELCVIQRILEDIREAIKQKDGKAK